MKQYKITGNWSDGRKTVTVNLPVMYFQEGDSHIAYVPVLDLSGYGNNQDEAMQSLNIVLQNYFDYTIKKNTLAEDLKAHGWTVRKKTKPYIAPELTDLINQNEYLHDIVNKKPYIMHRIDVALPEYA
jgi:hypothetical protein